MSNNYKMLKSIAVVLFYGLCVVGSYHVIGLDHPNYDVVVRLFLAFVFGGAVMAMLMVIGSILWDILSDGNE